ncbi:unnamed protein product [Penicillium salamii]|uniref:Transcription factor domain-containing protein n=1 Tax=Penicillium salamii TaxID=1612424 RepID=A0A9W4NAM3_9EURO|nr:unnamed protein product [Penicillium salamii]CAG8294396.1 unnamed protein product [Penicillium salamii]CAG8345690.1 unnamed protein product [Penicillium salamii]CAG8347684.1 unnamed protein product [Penicillium salamii]CAG8352768.1 unnamed protein product [Penicillium salamii]
MTEVTYGVPPRIRQVPPVKQVRHSIPCAATLSDDWHRGDKEDPRDEDALAMRRNDSSDIANVLSTNVDFCSMLYPSDSSTVDQEWARFHTGQLFSTNMLCRDHFGQNSLSSSPLTRNRITAAESPTIDAVTLPDRALLRKSVSSYTRSIIRATFPILDPGLFEETLTMAYEPAGYDHSDTTSAKACVIAFCIFVYLVPLGVRLCSESDFHHFTAVIQQSLPSLAEAPTIDGFQACIFLLISQFFTGKLKSAAVTNSIAAHFVFYMGAHHEWPTYSSHLKYKTDSDGIKVHLRNLFWVCYTADKELCLRGCPQPSLGDDHCDLSLSLEYLETISRDFAKNSPIDKVHPTFLFPIDIKLSQIKSRVYESLYSKAAFRKSNMELIMNIRTLDYSLEAWRMAVPEGCRPSLTFKDMKLDPGNIEIRALLLRLDYLYCVTVIHQASNRCLQPDIAFDVKKTANTTSIALAVEASRSSLKNLQSSGHIFTKGTCWMVLFYPLAATVTISCNILDNPAAQSAVDDYELLIDVPRIICNISADIHLLEESRHLDLLQYFVRELIDAAGCAMLRTRKRVV